MIPMNKSIARCIALALVTTGAGCSLDRTDADAVPTDEVPERWLTGAMIDEDLDDDLRPEVRADV